MESGNKRPLILLLCSRMSPTPLLRGSSNRDLGPKYSAHDRKRSAHALYIFKKYFSFLFFPFLSVFCYYLIYLLFSFFHLLSIFFIQKIILSIERNKEKILKNTKHERTISLPVVCTLDSTSLRLRASEGSRAWYEWQQYEGSVWGAYVLHIIIGTGTFVQTDMVFLKKCLGEGRLFRGEDTINWLEKIC